MKLNEFFQQKSDGTEQRCGHGHRWDTEAGSCVAIILITGAHHLTATKASTRIAEIVGSLILETTGTNDTAIWGYCME